MADFFQDPPRLANQYDDDPLLASYLRWRLPSEMLVEIEEPEGDCLGRGRCEALLEGRQVEAALAYRRRPRIQSLVR